jgi:hypothetical protein
VRELEKLLGAIEARSASNAKQDIVFCKILGEIVRDALGLPNEPPAPSPQPLVTSRYVPEFPQYRVKYSKDYVEIARRRFNSLDDFGRGVREDSTWATSMPEPIKE